MNCPTDGKCLARSVVYKAEVTSTDDNTRQTYIGITGNDFKTRYRNHLKSLRNEKYKHETELSKHVWNLKKKTDNFRSDGPSSSKHQPEETENKIALSA